MCSQFRYAPYAGSLGGTSSPRRGAWPRGIGTWPPIRSCAHHPGSSGTVPSGFSSRKLRANAGAGQLVEGSIHRGQRGAAGGGELQVVKPSSIHRGGRAGAERSGGGGASAMASRSKSQRGQWREAAMPWRDATRFTLGANHAVWGILAAKFGGLPDAFIAARPPAKRPDKTLLVLKPRRLRHLLDGPLRAVQQLHRAVRRTSSFRPLAAWRLLPSVAGAVCAAIQLATRPPGPRGFGAVLGQGVGGLAPASGARPATGALGRCTSRRSRR